MKKSIKKYQPVTIIITMRNAFTTIGITLESLMNQSYPIDKILILDNASSDGSSEFIRKYKNKSKIEIVHIRRVKNVGVANNFNLGVKKAKTELVVFMHSDAKLQTSDQMQKLVDPLNDKNKHISFEKMDLKSPKRILRKIVYIFL